MKLYGSYTSPYVRHCRIVIEQLVLDCDFVEVDHAVSAQKSPSMKVPFLQDGDMKLTDSTSILFHLYTKSGKSFIASAEEMDLYAMTNTIMDSVVNVFLLENDGVTSEASQYLGRQNARIEKGLDALESSDILRADENNIAATRVMCFLDWGLFRNRINLDNRPKLQAFVQQMSSYTVFEKTTPPS